MGPHLLFCSSVCQLPCTAFSSIFFFQLSQKLLECKEQGVPWSWTKKKKRKAKKNPR